MKRIIVMYEDKDRELNMSLYDFIEWKYRNAEAIMVCNVTKEEYSNMQKQVKSGYLNERLPRVTSETEMEYNKFRYMITYDNQENNLLVSDYNNPKKRGSYRIDSEGIHYNEKGYQITNHPVAFRMGRCEIKVYTTETYEDVISYYKQKQDRNCQIKEKTRELIELIGRSCHTCNTMCCGGLGEEGCDRWSHNMTIKYEDFI